MGSLFFMVGCKPYCFPIKQNVKMSSSQTDEAFILPGHAREVNKYWA